MVTKTQKQEKILYMCDECKLKYLTEELAKKCEAWCKEYQSCNIEIIKNAVNDNE